ncbi:hypothetical protein VNI00_005754 [Paramarasmius palmivorus]|uniref:C2H2-type domain-containing protein n=1 Tax=Paramarasmius palmivorus TaxID=297713 RepID=A0AAW0DBG5_9AGAR
MLGDLDNVIKEYTTLQNAVEQHVDGAESALEQWKIAKRAEVEARTNQVVKCRKWFIEAVKDYNDAREQRISKHKARIRSLLAREGFCTVDVDASEDEWMSINNSSLWPDWINYGYGRVQRITHSKWKKDRYQYIPLVERARDERLLRERQLLVEARKEVAYDVITNVKKATKPSLWPYWPPTSLIRDTIPVFQDLINSPSDKPITEQDCAEAIPLIQPFVDLWIAGMRKQYRGMIPHRTGTADTPTNVDVLSLATSVFSCDETFDCRHLLLSWEAVGTHNHRIEHDQRSSTQFNESGSEAVFSLLRVLGLDPSRTLAVDMDARNDRFLCLACPSHVKRRPVFNWREAVGHAFSEEHEQTRWYALPEKCASIIRKCETDTITTSDVWCCNHCPEHLESRVMRWYALNHVTKVHGIARPRPDIDYFYFPPSSGRPSRGLHMINIEAGGLYACMHCNLPRTSLLTNQQLRMHLKDK